MREVAAGRSHLPPHPEVAARSVLEGGLRTARRPLEGALEGSASLRHLGMRCGLGCGADPTDFKQPSRSPRSETRRTRRGPGARPGPAGTARLPPPGARAG
ncbi:hypothetical protein FV230_12215 [Methylobacterium sp. WL6]|nr:hypothetical protein FV230_12215 [Methylobacterium sp. WL6]